MLPWLKTPIISFFSHEHVRQEKSSRVLLALIQVTKQFPRNPAGIFVLLVMCALKMKKMKKKILVTKEKVCAFLFFSSSAVHHLLSDK